MRHAVYSTSLRNTFQLSISSTALSTMYASILSAQLIFSPPNTFALTNKNCPWWWSCPNSVQGTIQDGQVNCSKRGKTLKIKSKKREAVYLTKYFDCTNISF